MLPVPAPRRRARPSPPLSLSPPWRDEPCAAALPRPRRLGPWRAPPASCAEGSRSAASAGRHAARPPSARRGRAGPSVRPCRRACAC
eukprot:42436-Prymnesium_polylepis.1